MSEFILSESYKHYQIVVNEETINEFNYRINDPRTDKTIAKFHGFSTSVDAKNAAERAVDDFPVSKAQVLVADALNPTDAETAINAILNGNYTIVIDK